MKKVLDVFCVVECCGVRRGFGGFLLVAWFAGVDSLPNTEFSEIGEADLEFADSLSSGDKVFGLPGGALLLLSCHCCWFMDWIDQYDDGGR